MSLTGEQIGHYRLCECLGQGSYGAVYRAEHLHDNALQVAAKIIHPHLAGDPEFLTGFRAEYRQLERLAHPNIVGFRDLVPGEGRMALLMELLRGQDLAGWLRAGPLAVDTVAGVLEQALRGLAHAHAQGVVHRDVKPSNLFYTGQGVVKLVDFGFARAGDRSQASQSGKLRCTLLYTAPERFDEGGDTPAADVYALGLVAWELLVGEPACPQGSQARIMGWHWNQGAPDLREHRPDCPAWLAEVVSALCERDRSRRPTDGGAALALLGRGRPGMRVFTPPAAPAGPESVTVDRGMGSSGLREAAPSGPESVHIDRQASRASAPVRPLPPPATRPPAPPVSDLAPRPEPWADQADGPSRPGRDGVSRKLLLGVVGLGAVGLGVWALGRDGEKPAEVVPSPSAGLGAPAAPPSAALDLDWVSIPGGSFQRGSNDGYDDEKPVRTVRVSSFEMTRSEVTVAQYRACVEDGPCTAPTTCDWGEPNWGQAARDDHPVNCVSWDDAQVFARWAGGRLPTEAEWEYAARGGQSYTYAGSNTVGDVAWYDDNSGSKTHAVCGKQRNGYGLCDMSGNVWEWVEDWYHDSYTEAPTDGSAWVSPAGSFRVYRGGAGRSSARYARVANRSYVDPGFRRDLLGLRLVRSNP